MGSLADLLAVSRDLLDALRGVDWQKIRAYRRAHRGAFRMILASLTVVALVWASASEVTSYVATAPERTLRRFYHMINMRSYRAAWQLLSQSYQAHIPFDRFVSGYGNTIQISSIQLHRLGRANDAVAIYALVYFTNRMTQDTRAETQCYLISMQEDYPTPPLELTLGSLSLRFRALLNPIWRIQLINYRGEECRFIRFD